MRRNPKPKPNTEQCKTINRTDNKKPNKPKFRFGAVRFGSVCGLRVKSAQADLSITGTMCRRHLLVMALHSILVDIVVN